MIFLFCPPQALKMYMPDSGYNLTPNPYGSRPETRISAIARGATYFIMK